MRTDNFPHSQDNWWTARADLTFPLQLSTCELQASFSDSLMGPKLRHYNTTAIHRGWERILLPILSEEPIYGEITFHNSPRKNIDSEPTRFIACLSWQATLDLTMEFCANHWVGCARSLVLLLVVVQTTACKDIWGNIVTHKQLHRSFCGDIKRPISNRQWSETATEQC